MKILKIIAGTIVGIVLISLITLNIKVPPREAKMIKASMDFEKNRSCNSVGRLTETIVNAMEGGTSKERVDQLVGDGDFVSSIVTVAYSGHIKEFNTVDVCESIAKTGKADDWIKFNANVNKKY